MDDAAVVERVEGVGRVVGEQPRGEQLGERVGERERDALVVGDARSERLSLAREGGRLVEQPLGCSAAARGDEEALDEDPLLRAGVAARRHPVRIGYPAVGEDDLGVMVEVRVVQEAGRALDREAGRVGVDEEQRLLAFGDREDDVHAGLAFARDEPFLAVQDPVGSVPRRRRP